MADLRDVVEGLGCRGVRTLLNSGNVVFTPPRVTATLAASIQQAIYHELGVDSRVTVLPARQLDAIVSANPLGRLATYPSRYLVSVLAHPDDRARLVPLARQDWRPEAFALGERAAYLWLPDGVSHSRTLKAVEKAVGDRQTSRNWATILKLHALATSAD